ncbi:hypothetical protein [Halomonas sp. 15WGF]|uniref:hypothetical protein n=1 Tax=Halomonas sp. 15WGF TaxID=2570357 RepID=UPI0010BED667|nr:hypothetical protein [Halomonas sp. 15WGF]TKJ09419.1 hypothetical protein E8Q34_16885 [Halomonas sp. 15WGF]
MQIGHDHRNDRSRSPEYAKGLRIDAELVGQLLYAFFNGCPAEAKNKKRLIFGDSYDEIFSEKITSEEVLFVWRLFKLIESEKINKRSRLTELEESKRVEESFILYSDFYLLYLMRVISEKKGIEASCQNLHKVWSFYEEACSKLKELLDAEVEKHNNRSIYTSYFKNNKVKSRIEDSYSID